MGETLVIKEIWSNEDDYAPEDKHTCMVYVDFECGCWTVNTIRPWTGHVYWYECREGHRG